MIECVRSYLKRLDDFKFQNWITSYYPHVVINKVTNKAYILNRYFIEGWKRIQYVSSKHLREFSEREDLILAPVYKTQRHIYMDYMQNYKILRTQNPNWDDGLLHQVALEETLKNWKVKYIDMIIKEVVSYVRNNNKL